MKQNEIARLLPEVFRRTIYPGSPLAALLAVMEELHAPSEDVLEHLDDYFDPYRAPDRFVSFIAQWVDLGSLLGNTDDPEASLLTLFPTGLGRLRELVAAAAFLSKWRGTARGLLTYLEMATGVEGFEIDESVIDETGHTIPFHLRIRAPAETEPYRELIERVIEIEKPAYVTYELDFAS
jgi:phage tail-like protein